MMGVDPNYIDDGRLRGQDRVSLSSFLANDDRADMGERGQPFFSGREREIRAFRKTANALAMGKRSNATIVVEGPPGAGKSALLMQFLEEMRHLPNTEAGGRRWLPVPMNGSRAECPGHIVQAVDEAIALRLAQDCEAARGHLEEQEGASQALSAFLGEAVMRKHGNDIRRAARSLLDRGVAAAGFRVGAASPDESIEAASARRAPIWADWQIVLLIDEAQGISDGVPGGVPGTLSSIHQGFAATPISFCAFGLPGTWNALSKVDVSRTSSFHDLTLAGLDDAEARMAVDRCFERFGVRNAEAWAEAIIDRSAGWPQHLSAYLNGALSVLQERAGVGDEIGSVRGGSLRSAIALGDASRRDYYRRRLQRLNRGNARHRAYGIDVARWLRGANRTLQAHDALERLGGEHGLSDEAGTAFLDAAKHSGLFAEDADGNLTTPIPSFVGHLLGDPLPDIAEPHPVPGPSQGRSATHGS